MKAHEKRQLARAEFAGHPSAAAVSFRLIHVFFNAIRQLLLAQLAVCDQVIVLGGLFALSVA